MKKNSIVIQNVECFRWVLNVARDTHRALKARFPGEPFKIRDTIDGAVDAINEYLQ